jgi:hypothetical protein
VQNAGEAVVHDFKPIELGDKPLFDEVFASDPPTTSELTFTNLFMWRLRYTPVWKIWDDCLLIVFYLTNKFAMGLPPTGTGNKSEALDLLVNTLAKISDEVQVSRASRDFVDKHVDPDRYHILEDRDNSDYVYLAANLINLSGNRYHAKKNHLNRFMKQYDFEYRTLDDEVLQSFLELQEDWCELKDCASSEDLLHEDRAVYEALTHHEELGLRGGAILIDRKVEAFALGEKLNPDTAVIHIEKANPKVPGLYAVINQRFCAGEWSNVTYVNREQDLGIEGLRKAKLSYHPHHMVDKFILTPK